MDLGKIVDNGSLTAFWFVMGYLVVSNVGMIAGGVLAHIRKINRIKSDLDKAFIRIRILEKNLEIEPVVGESKEED